MTNAGPGRIRRLSVAVALSAAAMAKAKPAEIDQIRQLVSAAVGANPARGDQIAVVTRAFQPTTIEVAKFWETPWFAMAVRNAVALIAVLLTLLLGVRPLIRALKRDPAPAQPPAGDGEDATEPRAEADRERQPQSADPEMLSRQVGFAQRLVREKPDNAVAALRQMLAEPASEGTS